MSTYRIKHKPNVKNNSNHHDAYEPITIISHFTIEGTSEKAFKVNFTAYKGHHWIPKSQVVDKRFGIGRTPPKKGCNLDVAQWFFTKQLRTRLQKIDQDTAAL